MRLIHLNWSHTHGEGSVSYTKAFEETHWIDKLDMLKDCISDLTDTYNQVLLKDAADDEGFYGLPQKSVSSSNAGGNGVTDGETSP